MRPILLMLAGCLAALSFSAPRAALTAAPAAPGSQDPGAPLLEVDYDRSVLVAKLTRGGLLRFLGHEHGIVPGSWTAEVRYDPAAPQASSIVVQIDAASLVIDSDEARRLAGVDPDGPSDDDVREIRDKMLSNEQLDAARYPAIRFQSSALRPGSGSELRIDGTLTLRGVSREISVDADIDRLDGGWIVRGEFEIEQRDFGIEPVSIGGVVNVANDVEIRFEVYAGTGSPVGGDREAWR